MPYCKKCGNELPEGVTYCPKCGTAAEATVEAAPMLRFASWGERFVAWLIDVIILGIMIGLVRTFVWVAWPGFVWLPGIPNWIPFMDFGFSNLIHFLYWMLMDGAYGQSFGKMIMRIKVTRLDGKPADIGQAAIESIGKAFLSLLDCILGWVLYPSKKQRLFNHLSQTIVVRT